MADVSAKLLRAQVLTNIALCLSLLEDLDKVHPIEVRESLKSTIEGMLETSCRCIEMCDSDSGELS